MIAIVVSLSLLGAGGPGEQERIDFLQEIPALYRCVIREDRNLKKRKSAASEIQAFYLCISRKVNQLTFRHQKIGDFVGDPRSLFGDSMSSRKKSGLSH